MTIVCFYLREIFRAICSLLKEGWEEAKKVDGGKTFWRLNGNVVLYGFREFQSVILEDEVRFFLMENLIDFFYINKHEYMSGFH